MTDINEKLGKVLATQSFHTETLRTISEELKSQKETLTRNTQIVDEHQRRSTLLEQEVRRIEGGLGEVKDHVTRVEGVGRFIKWIGALSAALTSVGVLLKFLGKI